MLYEIAVGYWLAAQNSKSDYQTGDSEILRAFEFVKSGLSQEKLLCKEDALVVIHVAYFGDLVRTLRILSGMASLTRVFNILEALCVVVNSASFQKDKTAFRQHLIHDVLLNRANLEEDIKNTKHRWTMDEEVIDIKDNALKQRAVRMSLITSSHENVTDVSFKRGTRDPFWTFVKKGNKIDFYAVRPNGEHKKFSCVISIQGRTCALEEIKTDHGRIGLYSQSLEEFLSQKGAIFSPGKYMPLSQVIQ
jgi:hypothetical protein